MMSGSKYVNPTGDGYLGVSRVSTRGVSFGVGMYPVDWDGDTTVVCFQEPEGIGVVRHDRLPDDRREDVIQEYSIYVATHRGIGPVLQLGSPIPNTLDVEDGSDIRAYERDPHGIILVPKDTDPFLEGGGSDGV